MARKSAAAASKGAAKAAKKAKAAQKTERKQTKQSAKEKDTSGSKDDQDLEAILETMRREWEVAHAVTEEIVEPPSRRASAALTPCPNGNHIWCIGGEFYSEDNKAHFYNDVFRYSPDKDEWRKFISPTCPGPRSAHAVAGSPMGGGKLFLFGGEFSSLNQATFYHYRDFWCFDISTHSWDRIDTKIVPTARSGHRMAVWKHFVVLFGGFYDPGITTRYLNDLWIFDTHEYKWSQRRFVLTSLRPRSGFSFLPCVDGVVLHGGYCKEYVKGKRPVGVMLEDTWLLRLTLVDGDDKVSTLKSSVASTSKGKSTPKAKLPINVKWERRKRPSTAFTPPLRSGSTMALWQAKDLGIMFGGVTDEDTSEETLKSAFWNDLYSYQLNNDKGKWASLLLRRQKQKKNTTQKSTQRPRDTTTQGQRDLQDVPLNAEESVVDLDDPILTTPTPRYNAMLAVLRNTLYIFGGIFERGSREYTLDDFYSLQLDKMDRFICLIRSSISIPAESEESSSGSEDEDSSDSSDSSDDRDQGDSEQDESEKRSITPTDTVDLQAPEQEWVETSEREETRAKGREQDSLRGKAAALLDMAGQTTRSEEDTLNTPLPGETLAVFYSRSCLYWTQKAREGSANTGKMLRKDAFMLARERYTEYKPTLKEIERNLAKAGLNEEEIKYAGMGGTGAKEQNRNRR